MTVQKMRCGLLMVLSLVALSLSFVSMAQTGRLAPESIIRGLGMRTPNAPDVSLSRNFHVYEIDKDGVTYVQINDLNGSVATAIAMTGNGYFQLPIGYLSVNKVLLPSGNQQYGLVAPQAVGDAQCPCGGQVVYSGPNGTVIVVTDKNGNVIQVVVLQPRASKAA